MIPPFGFTRAEQAACGLMILSGAFGLMLTITGKVGELDAIARATSAVGWFIQNSTSPWVAFHSLLVMGGGIAAFRSLSFSVAFVGVVAALVPITPLGLLTFLPGLWLLFLMVPRRRSFRAFTPHWKGDGPPPPGQWK